MEGEVEEMKERYRICGTHRLGDKVRLFLQFDSLVKEKKESGGIFDAAKMLGNLGQLQEEIQAKAQLMQNPDAITIPYEEWKKYEYKVDDIVYVEVTSDKVEK